MLLIISDACVLIDIEQACLSEFLPALPFEFAIVDIVYEKELAERHSKLLEYGLICQELAGELIKEVETLRAVHRKVSVNDLLGLVLAKNKKSILLTGDRALRELATSMGLIVHGTIKMLGNY